MRKGGLKMILKNLKLKNFGCISDIELNLNNNINLISGNNGQGKSMICDAITLLLYNKTRGKLEDFIKWGEESFYLELDGEVNGQTFNISFTYSKKESTRLLKLGNTDQFKNSDAVKKLDEILSSSIALACSVVSQGSTDLIYSKPAERRELLKKIYNLNYINAVQDLDKQIKDKKENDKINNEKELYRLENKEYIEKELYEINEDEIKQLKDKNENILTEINSITKEIESGKEIYNMIQSLADKKNNLIFNIDKLEQKVKNAKKDILAIDSNSKTKIVDLEKEIEQLTIERKNKNQNFKDLKDEIDAITFKRLPSFDEEKFKVVNDEKIKLEVDIANTDNHRKNFENGICPTCGQDIDAKDLSELDNKISKLKHDLNNKITVLDNLYEEKKEIEKEIEEQRELKNKKERLKAQLASNIEKRDIMYNSLTKEINSKEDLIETTKQNYQSNKKLMEDQIIIDEKQIKSSKEDLDKLIEEIGTYSSKISNINLDLLVKKQKSFEDEKYNIEESLKEWQNKLVLNEDRKKFNLALTKEKENDKILIEEVYKKKDIILQNIKDLERCKVIFQKEFPNFVLSKLISSIEDNMNHFLNETYSGRYQVQIKEKRDSIYITYGPNKADIGNASGYEKQLISFAYKYALEKMTKINYSQILDEADSFASEENSMKFYDYIGNYLNNKQSVIITHKEATKDYIMSNFSSQYFEIENGSLI